MRLRFYQWYQIIRNGHAHMYATVSPRPLLLPINYLYARCIHAHTGKLQSILF